MVTIIYVLVNISYLTVMSPGEMLVSDAVAVTFGNRILGVMAWLMPLSVACSTFGAANGTIFAAGRLCYVASREGHLVDVLSFVHVKKMTPAPAVLFHALVAIGMVLSGSIEGLIDFFSFTVWIFYGASMLALIVLRYREPKLHRPYKVKVRQENLFFFIVCVSVSNCYSYPDADHQSLPCDSSHRGQSPDRVSLLHSLHGSWSCSLRSLRLPGLRL